MLFSLEPDPEEADWFHNFLMNLVVEALRANLNGTPVRPWKALVTEYGAEVLAGRHGLRLRYRKLAAVAMRLPAPKAREALTRVAQGDYYAELLSGQLLFKPTFELGEEFESELLSLFRFAFTLLADLKDTGQSGSSIRDELYRRAYMAMPGRFCPFCGIERFDAPHPDMPREALDHYLAISKYPIFGAHLRNLVPMCGKCNSRFKLAADMLEWPDGTARKCADPYAGQTVTISLLNSRPFGGTGNGNLPHWDIQFVPDVEEFETWDAVFRIRFRYEHNVLNADYRDWVEDFARWSSRSGHRLESSEEIRVAILDFAALCDPINDRGFIKQPMFYMLASAVVAEDADARRLADFLRECVDQFAA